MRVAIYGAGAMGTAMGAYFARAGKAVDVICRNRAHVSAMRKSGVRISGTDDFTAEVNALLPEEMEGRYDIIFLTTKQLENDATAHFLDAFLNEDGVLCTIQNGLPEYALAEILGKRRVLGCVCSWGASLVSPGEVVMTSSPEKIEFQIGSPFDEKAPSEKVREILSIMGRVAEEANFLGARWTKLIINNAFSPLSGLTGLTFGQIARQRRFRRIAQGIFNESAAVCRALGVKPSKIQGHDAVGLLSYNNPFKRAFSSFLFPVAMKNHSHILSGMYYDLSRGKKCEVEYFCGIVSSFGDKVGVDTPLTDKMSGLIGEIERGERAISPDNIQAFYS